MTMRLRFHGPAKHCIRGAVTMLRCLAGVAWRRVKKGPLLPGWNYRVEAITEILRAQLQNAFVMPVAEARLYLDAVTLVAPSVKKIKLASVCTAEVKGRWFVPNSVPTQATMLYLHGGGYSFFPQNYTNLISDITVASRCRTFALDYRLAPEFRFPAQLEDALRAYAWLRHEAAGGQIVLAGDSAGANLSLALLQQLHDQRMPLPDLVILLSPPAKFDLDVTTAGVDERFDWVQKEMLQQWANWFCDANQRMDPLVSPIYADLRGLPPLYIQDGGVEILHASIEAFVSVARQQGAEVVWDSWKDMNHDFQFFGDDAPQSRAALTRIGEVVTTGLRQASPSIHLRECDW